MKKKYVLILILGFAKPGFAQINPALQDSTLNNLVLPVGYKTCQLGDLGQIKKFGNGKQTMILIPGIGFGLHEFDDLISYYKSSYTIYAITAAGFNGTPAPPMPDTSVKYAELTWTNGIVKGVLNLIAKEKINKPIIVAHFVTGTQVAFNLAINHADKISKVIIIGGLPYRFYASPRNGNWNDMDWEKERIMAAQQRSDITEKWMAPKWFKTVTKKTWDDNMWTPDDYCKSPSKGKHLFEESAKVPVSIMVRYMIEWGAYDATAKYNQVKSPMLILIPDFNDILNPDPKDTISCKSAAAKQYLKYMHIDIWKGAKQVTNPLLQFVSIPGARIFMWYDKPEETYNAITNFLKQ